jgi:hypothetical protein
VTRERCGSGLDFEARLKPQMVNKILKASAKKTDKKKIPDVMRSGNPASKLHCKNPKLEEVLAIENELI